MTDFERLNKEMVLEIERLRKVNKDLEDKNLDLMRNCKRITVEYDQLMETMNSLQERYAQVLEQQSGDST